MLPRRPASGSAELRCTYISIQEDDSAFAVILAKPKWIWGAEMGVNEFGLALAIFKYYCIVNLPRY